MRQSFTDHGSSFARCRKASHEFRALFFPLFSSPPPSHSPRLQDEGTSGDFQGGTFLALLFGRTEEDLPFSKTSALFRYLFGYDLTDSLVLVDKRGVGKVTFLVSATKEAMLKQLLPVPEGLEMDGRAPVEIEILARQKGNEKADMDRITSRLKAGTVAGVWNKADSKEMLEPQSGPFADAFLQAMREEDIAMVDATIGIAKAFLLKDNKDVNFVKSSCSISDVVFKKFVVGKIEEEANEGKKISPSKLSDYIAGYYSEPSKISSKLQTQYVESCYDPVFSSASTLVTNLSDFEPSSKPLDYSIIVCGVGSKYRSLCSNVMRTVLINPTETITSSYNALVKAHEAACAAIKPNEPMSSVYAAAHRVLAEHDAALAACLDPNVGHSMGYEFYESVKLTDSSEMLFEANQIFNVMLVLQKVNNGSSAMALGDTVLVTPEGHMMLTKVKKDGFQYDLEDNDDDNIVDAKPEDLGKRKSRMREVSSLNTEQELREKQQENADRLARELERRAAEGEDLFNPEDEGDRVKDYLKISAYPRGASSFPTDAAPFRLVVDQENETILMPINGYVVPVHISLIKTVTKVDDTIRFQFHVTGKGKLSVSANAIASQLPNTVFIKEVVYHLQNSNLLASIDRSIKEMRKRVSAQEKRKTELAGITEQDHLILSRERAPALNALYCRPSVSGKRVFGTIEAHKNGFRYTTVKGQKLDIIYNNIAHAFFQPAEQEALVILHLNLRTPIMVGKKKCEDVQFVQETMEASSRLDSRRRNYGDADEIEEEQREKQARKKINRTFFKFCKDVEEFSKKHSEDGDDVIRFDYPSRELGFLGVPFKINVLLQPTAQDCLVHLVEGPPFFVLSLETVEVASFERVMFGLRQFDLVLVLKDYSKNPVTINSIPVEALETLQEWLTKSNVLFYLNPQPYNWSMIMNEVRGKTLKQFVSEGGWSFLAPEENANAEEGAESEGESEEFAPEQSESESDFDDDDDDDADGGGDDDDDDDDDEEDGSEEEEADWDELEKEAERKDKKHWGGAQGAEPVQKKRK